MNKYVYGYKPKDQVATEDKNNIVYETDCSNCEAVYFGESKRSLKSRSNEHKRSVRNCDCDKNEIAKHCWEADHNFDWDQKKVVDRESRLIPRKIKDCFRPGRHISFKYVRHNHLHCPMMGEVSLET